MASVFPTVDARRRRVPHAAGRSRRSPASRAALALLAFALAIVVARHSNAGCLNRCDLEIPAPVVQPPLACGSVRIVPNDCDCGFTFEVRNGCTSSIDALDFTFDYCTATDQGCTSLAPGTGSMGSIRVELTEVGDTRKTFHVRDADGDHQIDVVATVTAFRDPGCAGCTTVLHGRAAFAWFALAPLSLLRRRTRKRS